MANGTRMYKKSTSYFKFQVTEFVEAFPVFSIFTLMLVFLK